MLGVPAENSWHWPVQTWNALTEKCYRNSKGVFLNGR